MLCYQNSRVSRRPAVTTAFLLFFALSGCAKASDPELFKADPNLFDDPTVDLPKTGSAGSFNYEIIQGIAVFEGDILLGKVNPDGSLPNKLSTRGLGRSDSFGRWPDGIVPYVIPDNTSATSQFKIIEAIAHWTSETNVSFVARTTENQDTYPNYVRFEPSNSCASYVGVQGGEQPVLVSDACSVGSIIHEIGHALGLFHEHTRPDRDNFAQINWDEIVTGKDINFEILDAGVQTYGPYDYGSIMHYGDRFFSASGEPTIVVPDGIEIGQRIKLSPIDIDSMNSMYATDLALFEPTINVVEAGVEIGISVANQGRLGAQQLLLVATMNENDNWQGISADSGWECSAFSGELRCVRPTLTEQSNSDFTLLLNASSFDVDDFTLVLSSRTSDTDLSNNGFNQVIAEAIIVESLDPELITPIPEPVIVAIPEPVVTEQEQPETEAPAIGAAEVVVPSSPVEKEPIAAAATAGGSINGFLAIMVSISLVWRRQRRLVAQA